MATLRVDVSETPLRTEHNRLLRRLLRRGDQQPELRADDALAGAYDPRAVRLARENWRDRMVHEHQSAAVFAQLVPQLMEAGAPLDIKTTVTRSAMDELRHAGLCGQVVSFLGGEAVAEADLSVQRLPRHGDASPVQRALRNVLFASCLSETVSMALLTEERERTEEPFIRRVLKQLAGDESLHARIGWVYLGLCWPELDSAERQALSDYLPVALGFFERRMLDAMPEGDMAPPVLAEAEKLGFSESRRARSLFYDTMREVVLPQLDGVGLEASRAWKQRKRV